MDYNVESKIYYYGIFYGYDNSRTQFEHFLYHINGKTGWLISKIYIFLVANLERMLEKLFLSNVGILPFYSIHYEKCILLIYIKDEL